MDLTKVLILAYDFFANDFFGTPCLMHGKQILTGLVFEGITEVDAIGLFVYFQKNVRQIYCQILWRKPAVYLDPCPPPED